MRWLILMVFLGGDVGCARQSQSSNQAEPPRKNSTEAQSAFSFDESGSRILLDTQCEPPQRRRIDIGQGAITIETIAVANNVLTFLYTPELEDGYTVYECKQPRSDKPVLFEIDSSGCPGKTSFDLSACKIIKSGSVHFDN